MNPFDGFFLELEIAKALTIFGVLFELLRG